MPRTPGRVRNERTRTRTLFTRTAHHLAQRGSKAHTPIHNRLSRTPPSPSALLTTVIHGRPQHITRTPSTAALRCPHRAHRHRSQAASSCRSLWPTSNASTAPSPGVFPIAPTYSEAFGWARRCAAACCAQRVTWTGGARAASAAPRRSAPSICMRASLARGARRSGQRTTRPGALLLTVSSR